MAENSNIEWTDHTFNPWIGCTKVSPGCDHCYAETWDARGLQGSATRWGPHASRTRTSAANWRKPLKWNRDAEAARKRARVFCASLADVFDNHGSITSDWRGDLWHLIAQTPHLDWLLLTKRPQNIAKMLPDGYGAPAWGDGWSNVWLGTTCENQQEADRRLPHLLNTPAAVRFVSAEPLLSKIDLARYLTGHGHSEERREHSLPSRTDGRDRDPPGRNYLEGQSATVRLLDASNEGDPVQASPRREQHGPVSTGSNDAQRDESQCSGSSVGMAALQRRDTRRSDDQPQEREQDGQPATELGGRNGCGASVARAGGSGEDVASWGAQQQREVDGCSGCRNSDSEGCGRTVEDDRNLLQRVIPSDLKNSAARPSLTWVIIGGESGTGARPMDNTWAQAIVDQCKTADVAVFVKQLSGGGPKAIKDMALFPEALRVREMPETHMPEVK